MNLVFYLLIGVAVAGLLTGGIVLLVKGRGPATPGSKSERRRSPRERTAMLREARRRLEQDDRDYEALLTVADLSYEAEDYLEAFKHYQTLAPLAGAHPGIEPFHVNVRLGHAALKLKNPTEAYRAFLVARSADEKDFEVNYNLGLIEYGRRRYAKAAGFLTAARARDPDHPATNRHLGTSLYLLKMYPEAVRALEKTLDFEPEDRQTQYILARTYYALNQTEPALGMFLRLRSDPKVGANACLFAGTIHAQTRRFRQAIEDFELGLRHAGIPAPVALELQYRLAAACLKEGEINRAVKLWGEIAESHPGYKDVQQRLKEYREITRSRNLQAFVVGPGAEFISLCRKLAVRYFPGTRTSLTSIDTRNTQYVDIQAQVRSRQAEESVLFRFIRSSGVVGELVLREFYVRLKDLRAARGVCVSAGSFSEEASRFVEARMIDLVGRDQLLLRLNSF